MADSCDAPSGAAGVGVGALGFVLTPTPLLGIPVGLLLHHYGKKDCTWWAKSAGTGMLIGSAAQVVLIAGMAVATKLKVDQMQAGQGASAPSLPTR